MRFAYCILHYVLREFQIRVEQMKAPPPELLKKAESGDSESQYSLAAMYGAADFVTKSDVEAARWYRAAADHGQVEAQRNLGLMWWILIPSAPLSEFWRT